MTNSPPNARTRKQIDDNLRRVYQSTVDEDLPDRFKDLLAQLKQQSSDTKSSGDQ